MHACRERGRNAVYQFSTINFLFFIEWKTYKKILLVFNLFFFLKTTCVYKKKGGNEER